MRKEPRRSKEYLAFVMSNPQEIPQGVEIELDIIDLAPGARKYETLYVKGIVSSQTLPGGDVLWLRNELGHLNPHPWSIKILGNDHRIGSLYKLVTPEKLRF